MKKNKGTLGITLAMCVALAAGSMGCGAGNTSGNQQESGDLKNEDSSNASGATEKKESNENGTNPNTEPENKITSDSEQVYTETTANGEDSENSAVEQADKETTETNEETSSTNEENSENSADKSNSDADNTSAQADKTQSADIISGNGGHFVEYEGKVYFRIPSEEAMKEAALWGNYDGVAPEKGCTIAAFDPETLETTELFEDKSYGSMVISGGRLVMSESNGENEMLVQSVSLDGSDRKELPGTKVYGTQPSGEYFITGGYEADNKLHFYICDSNGDSTEINNTEELYNYAGVTENYLFCITKADENPNGTLVGYELKTGKEVIYGDIPEIVENYPYSALPEYLYEDDGYAYLQLSVYEGTGNFYSASKWVKVTCDNEGSLEEVTPKGKEQVDYDDLECPKVILKDGELTFVEGIPGTAAVNYEGDAGFYDENGKFISVAAYYGTTTYDNNVDHTNTEFCELVGDYIYVVKNEEVYSPEDCVGWRDAYCRKETNIKRINTENGDDFTIANVKNPDADAEDSANGEDPLKGLVADDILTKFRSSNPVQNGASVYEEASALGSWTQDTIGKNNFPKSIRDMGTHIGNSYEFCFGTDIANSFENNVPGIYGNYYALKDYYTSDGKRSVKRYEDLMGDNEFLGDGKSETLEKMYLDLQEFITACNNIIRKN